MIVLLEDYCHIGISELQYLLLKPLASSSISFSQQLRCCLLMGVSVELGVEPGAQGALLSRLYRP